MMGEPAESSQRLPHTQAFLSAQRLKYDLRDWCHKWNFPSTHFLKLKVSEMSRSRLLLLSPVSGRPALEVLRRFIPQTISSFISEQNLQTREASEAPLQIRCSFTNISSGQEPFRAQIASFRSGDPDFNLLNNQEQLYDDDLAYEVTSIDIVCECITVVARTNSSETFLMQSNPCNWQLATGN